MRHHSIGNFFEACYICTGHQVITQTIALGNLNRGVVDVLHDALQLLIHFLSGPVQTLGVLGHLQLGNGHAAGVDGLGGSDNDVLLATGQFTYFRVDIQIQKTEQSGASGTKTL